jgi:ubiquitin C
MQTQSGRSILLTVELSETIDDIRYKVYVKEGINVDQQRIFHNGILCRDGILVRDMFLRNNDKLFLVIRGRGG